MSGRMLYSPCSMELLTGSYVAELHLDWTCKQSFGRSEEPLPKISNV